VIGHVTKFGGVNKIAMDTDRQRKTAHNTYYEKPKIVSHARGLRILANAAARFAAT